MRQGIPQTMDSFWGTGIPRSDAKFEFLTAFGSVWHFSFWVGSFESFQRLQEVLGSRRKTLQPQIRSILVKIRLLHGLRNRRFLWTCNGSKCAEVIVMVVMAMNVRRQQTSNWCDRHFQLPSLISLSFLDVLVFEASDISRTVCNQNASVLLFRVYCICTHLPHMTPVFLLQQTNGCCFGMFWIVYKHQNSAVRSSEDRNCERGVYLIWLDMPNAVVCRDTGGMTCETCQERQQELKDLKDQLEKQAVDGSWRKWTPSTKKT